MTCGPQWAAGDSESCQSPFYCDISPQSNTFGDHEGPFGASFYPSTLSTEKGVSLPKQYCCSFIALH
jgi:hypothetical protein